MWHLHDHSLSDFKCRCSGKLEILGDVAISAEQHDEPVSKYSISLSLDPATSPALFIKRSHAYAARGSWKEGLNDANEVPRFCLVLVCPC